MKERFLQYTTFVILQPSLYKKDDREEMTEKTQYKNKY